MARQQATTTSWTHLIVYQVVKDQDFPRSASASKPYVTHKTKEHWVGLEPTSSHYKSEILAARRPVQNQIVSYLLGLRCPASTNKLVGPEGFEPSPNWVRTSHAAITPQSHIRLVGVVIIESLSNWRRRNRTFHRLLIRQLLHH